MRGVYISVPSINKNTKWVNKNGINKRIRPTELLKYVFNGWKIGHFMPDNKKANKGIKNGRFKRTLIYDNDDNLIYDTKDYIGNFSNFLKEHNLPPALMDSRKNNGNPIYIKSKPNKKEHYKFKGWYAKVFSD